MISGVILTKSVLSDNVEKDTTVVRSYISRSQKMIAWIEANSDDIDNKKHANLTFSFDATHLKVKTEDFFNL